MGGWVVGGGLYTPAQVKGSSLTGVCTGAPRSFHGGQHYFPVNPSLTWLGEGVKLLPEVKTPFLFNLMYNQLRFNTRLTHYVIEKYVERRLYFDEDPLVHQGLTWLG